MQRRSIGSDGAYRLEAIDLVAGKRTRTVLATAPLRGVGPTSHFMHHVRRQLPDVARSIGAAAESRHERDRRRARGQAG